MPKSVLEAADIARDSFRVANPKILLDLVRLSLLLFYACYVVDFIAGIIDRSSWSLPAIIAALCLIVACGAVFMLLGWNPRQDSGPRRTDRPLIWPYFCLALAPVLVIGGARMLGLGLHYERPLLRATDSVLAAVIKNL